MALPVGSFTSDGSIPSYGILAGSGAFTYAANTSRPWFYAGEFTIDTGYDDPVSWTLGVNAAEVYGARVYPRSGTIYPAPAAGAYTGDWRIEATPMWSQSFYASPSSGVQNARVLIHCKAYLKSPISTSNTAWQRLDNVDWTLYRV